MSFRHILSAAQFEKQDLEEILTVAESMREQQASGQAVSVLQNKIVACLFFEPSTRTRLSFEAAALRLGAQVIGMETGKVSSSAFKGESLEDTIRIVQSYADIIVMRHPKDGAAEVAAKVAGVPFINAGDGGNQHPTQALLDIFTIRQRLGRLDNLRVGFGFDPLHSRTIRSLALLLTHYPENYFTFICPKSLDPSPEFLQDLAKRGAKFEVTENLNDFSKFDVFYANRLQQERFVDQAEFEALRKKFVINYDLAKNNKALILDPLPRIDEIESEVDSLPNAAYFEQAQNGLYVRMALFKLLSTR